MKSCVSEVRTIVLVPGWATDCRIFEALDLGYDYRLPIEFPHLDFEKKLSQLLDQKGMDKISLFGYSLGAFLACEFAAKSPDKINELILVGCRRQYPIAILQEVEARLKKNKRASLREFYAACFSPEDKEGYSWFKKHLQNDYLENLDLEGLICGLDYLKKAKIDHASLKEIKKIRIFHGREDKIAPLEEISGLRKELPQAKFIFFPGLGHLPFLNMRFKESFSNG